MNRCGRCGEPFTPGDELDLAGMRIPGLVLPLIAPHLSRLTFHRCSAPECGGLVTALYLPRTPRPIKTTAPPRSGMPVSS